jgi:ABC-type Zn uptake system ZnuABC Zn-binding protein ZnuA
MLMLGRTSVLVIAVMAMLAILAGCSSVSDTTPANLSQVEKDKLMKGLRAVFVDRYPNDQGLVKIYGELSNTTNRHIISVTVTASDVETKEKNVTYGKLLIENVGPGEERPFEIVTGKGIDDVGDEIVLNIIDAQFR